jgi:hypothetical protein
MDIRAVADDHLRGSRYEGRGKRVNRPGSGYQGLCRPRIYVAFIFRFGMSLDYAGRRARAWSVNRGSQVKLTCR